VDYIFYPGCLISYRFPFIEKSTRLVAERFGIKLIEAEGFTCCPDPQGLQSYDEELWILTAARNLAIAEKMNLNIFTICNGCYSTFRKVATLLKENSELFDKINEDLAELGLHYSGKTKVKHIHEVILQDISIKKLKNAVSHPLEGHNVAIHYGCHITRPSTIVEFNDNQKPETLEQIVAALGATPIEYEGKEMCCGGAINIISEDDSFRYIQKKLSNIKQANADYIVVVCPYCYLQFEMGQIKLQKQNFEISIPVLHLSELIALAMEIETAETLLQMHKIKPDLSIFQHRLELERYVAENFDLDLLKNCVRCRACSKDCSLVSLLEHDPLYYVDLVLAGRIDEAIQDEGIWYCLNCFACLEKCPQRMGLAHFFIKLRNLAVKEGYIPAAINAETQKFLKDGVVTGKLIGARKRLDLPITNVDGIKDLKNILKKRMNTDVVV